MNKMASKRNILRKRRIIQRIVSNSNIYTFDYLNYFTLDQLIFLQKTTLVELTVKLKFKNRHNLSQVGSNL